MTAHMSRRPYVERDGQIANLTNTVGHLTVETVHQKASVEWHTLVATPLLMEWAELVRYYHPEDRTPVQVGLIDVEEFDAPSILAATKPDDDHVVAVAPRLDGDDP